MSNHSTSRRMKMLRTAYRLACAEAGLPCWLCGQAIDYEAEYNDTESEHRFQLDHFYPVSTHPEHREDPANFRPSGASCNAARGNKTPTAGLGSLSEEWY